MDNTPTQIVNLQNPDRIGKYQIESMLDKGGMGVVYKAYDPDMKRHVAIKIIRADLLAGSEDFPIERFKAEAESAGRLIHTNIVVTYEYSKFEDFFYIAMELVEGRSLKEIFDNAERFSLSNAVQLQYQILDALGYMHRQGVIHRDIKPGNILIRDDGTVKIADFGIAHLDTSSLTNIGDIMGSPGYAAPEQWQGLPVTEQTDIFSAGVILYELLTGEKPFSGRSHQTSMHTILHVDPIAPSDLNNSLNKDIDAVLKRALQKRPDERFRSAEEFSDTLRMTFNALQKGESVKTPGGKRKWIALGSFLLSAAAVFVGSYWWLSTNYRQAPTSHLEPAPSIPQQAYGFIEIKSSPPGATVLVDNETPAGITPVTVNLLPGQHHILLKKDGFYELEASIDVEAESKIPLDVRLIEIEPANVK